MSRRLIVLPVSPWSERARWALDHHRLSYEKIEHVPFLGERKLRRLVGPEKKHATVPVLLDGDRVLTESWDIALYADREGKESKLIPSDREAEIKKWNDLADETMMSGRGIVVAALLASSAALDESAPPSMPRAIRPLFRPMMRYGTGWFARKYGLIGPGAADRASRIAKLRETFETLRAALGKSPYVLGTFSYADIVMAISLQSVTPVDARYVPLGPATRATWTLPELAAEFADLIAWRDRVYQQHRQ